MINKITPNFLPCGIPPFGDFHSEMVFPIRNAWVLFLKNAFIEFSTFVVIRAVYLSEIQQPSRNFGCFLRPN